MKQFFKFMLASIAGTIISMFLFFFIFIVVIGGAISSAFDEFGRAKNQTAVSDNTILQIQFDQPIVDRGPEEQLNFDFGIFENVSPLGLNQILKNIHAAKNDDRIPGIYLNVSNIIAGMATVDEIRNALIDFKSSGKWIVSYAEVYSQKAYYLASVSDEIYVYPRGVVDFRGLSVNITFFKDMLDKIGVEAQIIRGTNNIYKSAVEPFIMNEMSQANRAQTTAWLSAIWNNIKAGISKSRGISQADLQTIADEYLVQNAQDAVDKGLVTGTLYYDELLDTLRNRTETELEDDIKSVTLRKYIKASKPGKEFDFDYKKPKIAVIYATGAINSSDESKENVGSEAYAKALRQARKDTTVKAIVLRVNSPGGGALASDVIWREVSLASEAKPLVVSMGDVAASGGYYISAAADKIYAMPNTITGSIGVFGIIPNVKELLNQNLGINIDGVKTAQFADLGNISRPLTDAEYAVLQTNVDQTYHTFLNRVALGRDMTFEAVDSIAKGHVWVGSDAIELGLIDAFGGLDAAIEEAARLADIQDYTRQALPKLKDPFEKFMDQLSAQIGTKVLNYQFGDDRALLKKFETIRRVKNMKGIQMVVPYALEVK